jgi:acyl-CoA thioesterase FadM
MDGWTETWRGIVSPSECDITEHFTIAYYFDRLADAAATTERSLGLDREGRSANRRVDVRFARELRAGASFHILSAPIALDEAAVRLGHQFVDSGNGEVTAWVEETLDIMPGPLPGETRDAISRHLLPWPGPAVERRPEPSTTEGFIPTARDRVKPMDLGADGNFALAGFVHRFTAGCVQALAAIGATASYIEAERKGYSTFELTLQV